MSEANGALVQMAAATTESVLLGGDLEKLSPGERVSYMVRVCDSLGLNHLTKPFEFLKLNGRLVMYARKDATEQLRKIHGVSVRIVAREVTDDIYVVTAQATDRAGRCDESIGAVPLKGLVGEAKANALMKAETKAKRRVTLSISGLGVLDESEVDSIPGAECMPEYTPPKAPASLPPASNDIGERALRINQLTMMKAPDGLGWTKVGAKGWLKKRFGVESTGAMTEAQQKDAELLLLARLDSEDTYNTKVEMFANEGRCLGDGEVG